VDNCKKGGQNKLTMVELTASGKAADAGGGYSEKNGLMVHGLLAKLRRERRRKRRRNATKR